MRSAPPWMSWGMRDLGHECRVEPAVLVEEMQRDYPEDEGMYYVAPRNVIACCDHYPTAEALELNARYDWYRRLRGGLMFFVAVAVAVEEAFDA